ncbi:penicillin acylase family protein [Rapidithrix thailandica]|uniref:Penicillin acylase family protein n=1 Tax=Rapidithrix thailandica TaxID=413964 RepID=A0AAW9SJI7_9BACT
MKVLKLIVSAAISVALIAVLNMKMGMAPPLGKFLDPFHGFWQNSETMDIRWKQQLTADGLQAPVKVVYDDVMVPHIFAENDDDLYFAQGYVTAQHRLWQMEFQTHAASGRLSELVGDKALEFDRRQRRRGMVFAAENFIQQLEKSPQLKKVAEAYTRGVNAYIQGLSYEDLPLEYKLLNYQPEEWTLLKCALFLKYMASDLTLFELDLEYTNAMKLFGRKYFDMLYPDTVPGQDPIVNGMAQWNFEPTKVDTVKGAFAIDQFVATEKNAKPHPDNGSNNWAVGGSKTRSGNPILCNDPHLGLNLPSIWYQIQLHSPEGNVYGASLPGVPTVIIGFNEQVAWGVTNAKRDVVDWYKVEFKDDSREEYKLDGEWVKTRKRVEEIKLRGSESYYDTVCYTIWGPVLYDETFEPANGKNGYAFRWIAHDPSEEMHTFYKLNKARNYQDYLDALDHYTCPAQNFVFAATNGDIAMKIQGKFPVKWPEQGKFLMDGTHSVNAWQAYIPSTQNVHHYNPARGFVSSANQYPVDTGYPYYVYDARYEQYRNRRINQVLDSLQQITAEDMMNLQNDNYNLIAAENLPFLLRQVESLEMNEEERKIYEALQQWDFFNEVDVAGAAYFEAWFDELKTLVWDEMQGKSIALVSPSHYTTFQLLKENADFEFFDVLSTPEKENACKVIQMAFQKGVKRILSWKKEQGKEMVKWGDYKGTYLQHLARLEPFNIRNVQNGGNHNIVNATSERHGPSWRMVVELDPKGVKAWGVYPGGQSGNVGSPYYNNLLPYWEQGKYYPLLFMQSVEEKSERIIFDQTLQAK